MNINLQSESIVLLAIIPFFRNFVDLVLNWILKSNELKAHVLVLRVGSILCTIYINCNFSWRFLRPSLNFVLN